MTIFSNPTRSGVKRLWTKPGWHNSYDVVIIGGGLHGLAAAYFLAKDHGITNVAVIEKKCIGYGASGRNTCIVRADQRTRENLPLYKEGLALWPQLISDLDYNLMFVKSGCLNIAHSEDFLNELRLSALTANFYGQTTHEVDAKQCKELMPALDISDRPKYRVVGGVYHEPGGTIRHDAVVWALAKGASALGVHIHQGTEVRAIRTRNGRITGIDTNNGPINTPKVLNAAGGYSPQIAAMVDLELPTTVIQMEAMVTEPLKPFLDLTFVSFDYDVFGSQTLRGELVSGADMDPWPTYSGHTAARYLHTQASLLTEVMPCLKGVKFMRIWSGLTDMTADMAPIMEGDTPIKGYYMDAGWGYFGFKSSPIAGRYMAHYIATENRPETIAPFALDRFQNFRFQGERATATQYGPWN